MESMIPQDKFDQRAIAALQLSSDAQVLERAGELLEWLRDSNWPIFTGISDRLSPLGVDLVSPIKDILEGDDSIWKANIISHLIPSFSPEAQRLYTPLLENLVAKLDQNDLMEGAIDFAEIQIGKAHANT